MSGVHHHGHGHGAGHGHHHASRSKLTARAAMASVTMAALLVGLKAWGAYQTGSTAMLGSLADTALDFIASIITLVGVRVAAAPADDDHRFGHGKAEALVAMVQIFLIAGSALWIGWRAIERFRSGALATEAEYGIGISLIAIALTLALLAYQRSVIKRTGSLAIATDNLHYQSDLALNGAVIVALLLEAGLGLRGADPAFGLAIAAWLLWNAYGAASSVVDQLMDREWPAERKLAFIEVAMQHPEARGIHDLRTRTSGAHDFVQFHLWVRPDMSVLEAHDVMDRIEADLEKAYPGVEILIHPDPEGHTDEIGYVPSETLEHHEEQP